MSTNQTTSNRTFTGGHGITGSAFPPNFSHWEPESGAEPGSAHTVFVDRDGQRWVEASPGSSIWNKVGQPRPATPIDKETPVTTPIPAQGAHTASELTGIRSSVAVMEQIAAVHGRISTDEGFLGSLARMEVGSGDRGRVADAQQASKVAGAAWAHAAKTIAEHNLPLQEAYRNNPDAANKHANTNE